METVGPSCAAMAMADPRVLIVSAQRNEGPYLIDWLAHLIGAGATGFLIYSNDCEDGSDAMLDLLDAAGIVEHRRHSPDPGTSVQWHAFRDAWKSEARKSAEWALVCDVDEFINIRTGSHSFADLIATMPDGTDAIALAWRLFGANGQACADTAPVTERFTRASRPGVRMPLSVRLGKTLLRLKGPFNQFGIHRPKQKSPAKAPLPQWRDGSGAPLPEEFIANDGKLALPRHIGRDFAEMNHYALRSAEEFLLKAHRGLPNRRHRPLELSYWVERNFNTVEETSIQAMAPATRTARANLIQIPGLAEAEASAIAWHREMAARILNSPAGHALWARAQLTGDTRELSDNEAELIEDTYHRMQANRPPVF